MAHLRREEIRERLKQRTQESYDRRDDMGKFGSYLKGAKELPMWKAEKGTHIIDIVPYIVGTQHPTLREGDIDYVLDVWVHFGVGVNEDQYVCPAKNYKQNCPICEHERELRRQEDYDEDLVKDIMAKRRTVYNILCWDTKAEQEKGIQIFEVAHWYVEKYLTALAHDGRTNETLCFSDIRQDEGRSIQFERKGEKRGTEFIGHKFLDRDYDLDERDIEDAFCLDELLIIPTYEELRDAYWGDEAPGEPEPEETSRRRRRSEPEPEPERGRGRSRSRRSEPEPEPELERGRGRGRRSEPEPETGRRRQRSEPEPEPETKRRRSPRRSQDDEPEPERGRGRGTREETPRDDCPHGGRFGEDLDQIDACNECEIYDDCVTRNEELESERKNDRRGNREEETPTRRKRRGRGR